MTTQVNINLFHEMLMSFTQFLDAPNVAITFIYNNMPQTITLKLPLTINKFFEPTEMNGESFFARWKNLGRYFVFLYNFV